MSRDAIVVGAGIAGLSLGRALARRGLGVRVLEATVRPGGKIRSERSEGYLCEAGPISISVGSPEVSALLADLGLAGRVQRARPGRRGLFVGGLGPLPLPDTLAGLAAFRALGAWDKLALLRGLWPGRGPLKSAEDESLLAFGRRRLGARAAEALLLPSLPGAYAMDPATTGVGAAFPWLAGLGRLALARAFFGGGRLRRPTGEGRRAEAFNDGSRPKSSLGSFPEGMEELPRALAQALGDRLLLGSPLRRLLRRGRRWVAIVERGGATHEIEADVVVLALPAHAAVGIVAPLDPALARELAAIQFTPVSLVQLGFALPRSCACPRAEIHGLYVPSAEPSDLAGAAFPSAMFPDDRAPAGHALAVARFGGARRPEQARLSDHDLTKLAWRELAPPAAGPGPPAFAQVVRHEAALPQYDLGHRGRLAALAAGEARHPGLFFAGNSYRGLGVVECISDAERLAERIWAALAAAGAEEDPGAKKI